MQVLEANLVILKPQKFLRATLVSNRKGATEIYIMCKMIKLKSSIALSTVYSNVT